MLNMSLSDKASQAKFLACLDQKLDEKLQPMSKVMDSLTESISFMSDKFDSLIKRIDSLEMKYKDVESENKCLKASRLNQRVSEHEDEMNNVQQYMRRDCVEIAGIPQHMGENTNHIVVKVGEVMGINLDESDISISHRLPVPSRNESYSSRLRSGSKDGSPSNDQIPKIIVKFTRREMKEAYYSNRKYLRDKSSLDIGMGISCRNRIYISESLSPKNKELFAKSLKFKNRSAMRTCARCF